jgi:hypothetical protein
MNRNTDLFDDRIADWLEEDPTQAPRQLLDTVLAAMPQISQRRSAPWALPRLAPARRLWVGLAVLVVAGLLLAVSTLVVGPPPGPSPTPPTEKTFTSPIYGYAVRYPAAWTAVPGRRQILPSVLPCVLCEEPDNFWVVPDDVAITIAATPLPAGSTLESWTTSVTERVPAKFSFGSCPSTQEPITVAGEPGTLTVYPCPARPDSTVLWITVVHGGAGWHLVWTDLPGVDPATIRPRFDAFLATFTFGSAPLATATVGPTASAASGAPITDELIGAWHHPAPGWWWFLRAGDPECVQAVRTQLDCVVWQRGTTPREIGIATMSDGALRVAWKSGFCTSLTSTYSVALNGDSLNLVDIGGGCEGGNFALTRAGTGSAPTAPPQPAP